MKIFGCSLKENLNYACAIKEKCLTPPTPEAWVTLPSDYGAYIYFDLQAVGSNEEKSNLKPVNEGWYSRNSRGCSLGRPGLPQTSGTHSTLGQEFLVCEIGTNSTRSLLRSYETRHSKVSDKLWSTVIGRVITILVLIKEDIRTLKLIYFFSKLNRFGL